MTTWTCDWHLTGGQQDRALDPRDPILPQAEASSGAELQGSRLVSDNRLGGVPCAASMTPRPLVHDLSEVVLICLFMTKTEAVPRSRAVLI